MKKRIQIFKYRESNYFPFLAWVLEVACFIQCERHHESIFCTFRRSIISYPWGRSRFWNEAVCNHDRESFFSSIESTFCVVRRTHLFRALTGKLCFVMHCWLGSNHGVLSGSETLDRRLNSVWFTLRRFPILHRRLISLRDDSADRQIFIVNDACALYAKSQSKFIIDHRLTQSNQSNLHTQINFSFGGMRLVEWLTCYAWNNPNSSA